MFSKPIEVDIIKATKPDNCEENGLITFKYLVPIYVHTEILTHRTFSRNASSARAMSNKRYIDMGFYMPANFHKDKRGMQSSDEIIEEQDSARILYISAWDNAVKAAEQLVKLGVAKEEANRLIPPIKMIQGIITGTEYSWRQFLKLRDHPAADKAMQDFAQKIKLAMGDVVWTNNIYHTPMSDGIGYEDLLAACARLARVSYAKSGEGKDDITLAKTLLENGHLSPFEHIAFYIKNPPKSAINTYQKDLCKNYGWISFRSILESDDYNNWRTKNELITK